MEVAVVVEVRNNCMGTAQRLKRNE